MKDASTLYDEPRRVWSEIPIEVVNNAISDFEPSLSVCAALGGDCVNAHKAVLEAFRTTSAGEFGNMQTEDLESDQILRLKTENRTLFNQDMNRFTDKEQLTEDATTRQERIAENLAIYEHNCQICTISPDRVKTKMKLSLHMGQINGGSLSRGKPGAVLGEGKVVRKSRDFTNKHVFGFPSHISVSEWKAGLHATITRSRNLASFRGPAVVRVIKPTDELHSAEHHTNHDTLR